MFIYFKTMRTCICISQARAGSIAPEQMTRRMTQMYTVTDARAVTHTGSRAGATRDKSMMLAGRVAAWRLLGLMTWTRRGARSVAIRSQCCLMWSH